MSPQKLDTLSESEVSGDLQGRIKHILRIFESCEDYNHILLDIYNFLHWQCENVVMSPLYTLWTQPFQLVTLSS